MADSLARARSAARPPRGASGPAREGSRPRLRPAAGASLPTRSFRVSTRILSHLNIIFPRRAWAAAGRGSARGRRPLRLASRGKDGGGRTRGGAGGRARRTVAHECARVFAAAAGRRRLSASFFRCEVPWARLFGSPPPSGRGRTGAGRRAFRAFCGVFPGAGRDPLAGKTRRVDRAGEHPTQYRLKRARFRWLLRSLLHFAEESAGTGRTADAAAGAGARASRHPCVRGGEGGLHAAHALGSGGEGALAALPWALALPHRAAIEL